MNILTALHFNGHLGSFKMPLVFISLWMNEFFSLFHCVDGNSSLTGICFLEFEDFVKQMNALDQVAPVSVQNPCPQRLMATPPCLVSAGEPLARGRRSTVLRFHPVMALWAERGGGGQQLPSGQSWDGPFLPPFPGLAWAGIGRKNILLLTKMFLSLYTCKNASPKWWLILNYSGKDLFPYEDEL